jgi:2-keto-4-pentenoate hydratase/2-oxohepta-3-ene-1,7-dioic acid hydratase in catechol pathway
VALLAPCTPSKIIALWNNFHALGAKLDKKAPVHPLFLIKPTSSLAGPGEPNLMNENADFVQWRRAKGCDTFGCIGPMIATHFDWPIKDGATVQIEINGIGTLSNRLSANAVREATSH